MPHWGRAAGKLGVGTVLAQQVLERHGHYWVQAVPRGGVPDRGGDRACTLCPEGTYETGLGMQALANCTLCAQGKYQGVPRSTSCTLCGAGTYQTGLGMPEEARCA